MPKPIDTEVGRGHYDTLSDADLLATYRDALRGKETDHARRSATPADYGTHFEESIRALEGDIVGLRVLVAEYEARVAAAEPVVPDVVEEPLIIEGDENVTPAQPEPVEDVPPDDA